MVDNFIPFCHNILFIVIRPYFLGWKGLGTYLLGWKGLGTYLFGWKGLGTYLLGWKGLGTYLLGWKGLGTYLLGWKGLGLSAIVLRRLLLVLAMRCAIFSTDERR